MLNSKSGKSSKNSSKARAEAMAKAAKLRASAAAKRKIAAAKRKQSAALRAKATQVRAEANNLRQVIKQSNAFMKNLIERVQRADFNHAQRMWDVGYRTHAFTAQVNAFFGTISKNLSLSSAGVNRVNANMNPPTGVGSLAQARAGEISKIADILKNRIEQFRREVGDTAATMLEMGRISEAAAPLALSQAGRDFLIDLEGFLAVPTRINNEPYYTIGLGRYGIGLDSMVVAGNSDPHFIFNGVRYDRDNPMPQSVANQLLSEDIGRYQDPVIRFLANNNIDLPQHQFDALVADTYQRGQNTWSDNSRPLQDYLLNGDFADIEAATAAFNNNPNAIRALQDRRIMQAEYFVTGEYTDIRGR